MTWDEFKKMVDEKLAEAGKNGAVPVFIFDEHGATKKIKQEDIWITDSNVLSSSVLVIG